MVKKILSASVKNGSQFLFSQQKTILSGAFVIGLMLLTSAILGLVKLRLYASIVTPGPELDVFFAAFRIPDLMFTLLISGSLNAAFIPIFSGYISQKSRADSWRFASTVLNLTLILFVVLSVVFFILSDYLVVLVGSGFDPESQELLARLLRILLISPVLLGVSSFAAGILQSFRRFLIPFFSPVVYNLGAIFGILVLYPVYGIEGAAWGVVVGSVGHLLVQLPALKHVSFHYHWILEVSPTLKRMVKLSIPRTIGSGLEQFKILVLVNLASFLPVGSVSFFNLGQSIINVPTSILGISIAQASLPQFARLYAHRDWANLRRTFQSSFNQILFLIMPVMVVLIVLKIPVVRLVYGAGQFSWPDTVATSWVVALFAIGIFAQALNNLMMRLFFAIGETRLPVILGLVGTLVSLVIAAGVMGGWVTDLRLGALVNLPLGGIGGLAFAVSVGALVELTLLFYYLTRREIIQARMFLGTPLKIVFSALMMAVAIYIPVQVLDQIFIDTTRVINLVILVWLVVSTGFTAYLLTTWLFGVRELEVVFRVLWKIKDLRKSLFRLTRTMPTLPIIGYKNGGTQ